MKRSTNDFGFAFECVCRIVTSMYVPWLPISKECACEIISRGVATLDRHSNHHRDSTLELNVGTKIMRGEQPL
jgi:hypothetical protein